MPRNLYSFLTGMERCCSLRQIGGRLRLLVKRTGADFDWEIWKPYLSHHFSTFVKDCWHKSLSCRIHDPLSQNEKSSAYSAVRDRMLPGRPLMRMENRTGLNTLPWGRPLAGNLICEREEPTRTWKLRLERKEQMKENMFPLMPNSRSLSGRASLETLSYAFSMSVNTAKTWCLLASDLVTMSWRRKMWSVVFLLWRKPDWTSLRRL